MGLIGFLFAPAKLIGGVALDVLFGKEEPFDYPITGTADVYLNGRQVAPHCQCERPAPRYRVTCR